METGMLGAVMEAVKKIEKESVRATASELVDVAEKHLSEPEGLLAFVGAALNVLGDLLMLVPSTTVTNGEKVEVLVAIDDVFTKHEIGEAKREPKPGYMCSDSGKCDVKAPNWTCFEEKIGGKWTCAAWAPLDPEKGEHSTE